MSRPSRLIAAGLTIALLAGCAGLRDLTAGIVGAPTSDEVKAAADKLAEAEDKVAELELIADEADAMVLYLEAEATSIEQRRSEVRGVYSRLAGQLGELEGAAADAMVDTLQGLQDQLANLGNAADQAAALAAKYQAQAVELETAAKAQGIRIDREAARLAGFEDQTKAAIAGVTDFVSFAGETAASLGVPGAREAAGKVREGALGGLSALLLGGSIWGARTARRRRRERDHEAEERTKLVRVVTAVDKFGLLANAPEEAREAAKDFIGPAAHKALKLTLVENGQTAAA